MRKTQIYIEPRGSYVISIAKDLITNRKSGTILPSFFFCRFFVSLSFPVFAPSINWTVVAIKPVFSLYIPSFSLIPEVLYSDWCFSGFT